MKLNHSSTEGLMESLTTDTKLKEIEKGRWQFQSNPWSKPEPSQWEFYSLEQNYLIEKAYYDKQKEVDIGDYIISIKHMIQKKKGAMIQQRPIRRINWEGEIQEIDRSVRYLETELPKTMNEVFGSLIDFAGFFSRRNPEILDFKSQFEEIENSNDLNGLHRIIIPAIVRCLEIELMKSISEQLEDSSLSVFKRKLLLKIKENNEELILLFKKEFGSFEEFYGEIFRAYTMNTSLYQNLNKYLRNESWIEIDNVLPYAFCLCKAFFNLKLQTNSFKKDEVIRIEDGPQEPQSVFLFQGTALDEGSLYFYKSRQTTQEPFSWNCVTSTSTNRETAEEFMYKSADLPSKKYPVLFLLEVPIFKDNDESKYLKWIDIHEYSAIPKEGEVILAPGSVFEPVEICTDKDQRTTIRLKMKDNIQSLANEGLIMQGALQSKMMTEKDVKIVCLEGEELLNTLKCLAGNKLIEQVEFCMCSFDKRSLVAMMEILSTLERAQELKLISCDYQEQEDISSGLLKQVKRCSVSKVEISGSSGFDEILTVQNEDNTNWISLRELKVRGRENNSDDGGINDKIFQRFRNFNQLVSLTLDFFGYSAVFDKTDSYLIFDELKHLTQLTSLTVSFNECSEMTNEGVHSLASVLKDLTRLTFLTLDFFYCNEIAQKGIHSLAFEGLRHLIQLKSLTLNFDECYEITDKEVKILISEGLRNPTHLTSLDLNFSNCDEITDEGVLSLAFQGLRNLTKLTSLVLDLSWCGQITNKGLRSLIFQGLRYLTKLTSLSLNFGSCQNITNKGVRNLAFEGLRYLTKLTSLTLKFLWCKNITNKGVRNLASQGIRYLSQLTSLTVDFIGCEGVTDKGTNNLRDQVLRYLSHLECSSESSGQLYFHSSSDRRNRQTQNTPRSSERNKLILRRVLDKQKQLTSEEFSTSAFENLKAEAQVPSYSFQFPQKFDVTPGCLDYKEITNKGVSSLSQKLRERTQLTNLTLDFRDCRNITDEELRSLASEGLQSLNQLTSLTLSFWGCYNITDEGVRSLASHGLQHLTRLISLTLNFWGCNITNEGVRSLASEGFQYLTKLTSLTLEFSGSTKITDEGVQNLASKGLQYLTKLTSLALSFEGYFEITDKGVQNLASQGLQHSIQLTSLDLNFWGCTMTDEGMQGLVSQGLRKLTQLTSLTLNFGCCRDLTDKSVHILAFQGLKHMTQLASLALDFGWCSNITDKSIHILAFQGLKHMTQLSSFTFDLQRCSKITDFMFSNFIKVLHYLGFVVVSEIDTDS